MKVKLVPALRSKRGLRRVSGAEPQVVGLTPQTTEQRKADTIKIYILRDPKAVERETPPQKPVHENPPVRAPVDPLTGLILFIGLDVHKDSIAVSLAPSDTTDGSTRNGLRPPGATGRNPSRLRSIATADEQFHHVGSTSLLGNLIGRELICSFQPKIRAIFQKQLNQFYRGIGAGRHQRGEASW